MRRICVFCGSSMGFSPRYAHRADAALAAGGEVHGIIPEPLRGRELAHAGLTALEVTAGMHPRKARMVELADAFVAMPGGFGTLDELFEALTAALLGHHAKPIVLVDLDGYYGALLRFIDDAVAAGFIRPEYRALLAVVATPDEALALLARM